MQRQVESRSSRPAWFTQESQASQAYILRLCLKNNKSNPLTNQAELMNQHRPTNPRLLQALGKATSHYLISRAFFFFFKGRHIILFNYSFSQNSVTAQKTKMKLYCFLISRSPRFSLLTGIFKLCTTKFESIYQNYQFLGKQSSPMTVILFKFP